MAGLVITELVLSDFRSYKRFAEQLDQGLTIVVGPNAVGKTNVVEAIQLLTAGESFRKPSWPDLIRWGAEEMRISLKAEGDARNVSLEMRVFDNRREVFVNDKRKTRRADFVGILPSVIFTPDHLRLVKDSAEARRAAIDAMGVQLSPAFSQLRAEYERVVKQRNRLLKDGDDGPLLKTWTERLLDVGSRFIDARIRLFDRVSNPFIQAHRQIASGGNPGIRYVPFWERDGQVEGASITESFERHLRSRKAAEHSRGTTLSGPHRDDIVFTLDEKDARAFASQGQQRTIALSWKLAEVEVTREILGQPPVLLLDDVMSELDDERRHALASKVGEIAQTVLTTTNLGYFDKELVDRAKVVFLR